MNLVWMVAMVVTLFQAKAAPPTLTPSGEIRRKISQIKSRAECLKNCDGGCNSKCSTKGCECCAIKQKVKKKK